LQQWQVTRQKGGKAAANLQTKRQGYYPRLPVEAQGNHQGLKKQKREVEEMEQSGARVMWYELQPVTLGSKGERGHEPKKSGSLQR
jgi:hypothetical protein